MSLRDEAMRVLEATSRTFYLPIVRLPSGLQDAVAAAYLCMRAIDEIEDHPYLEAPVKAELLKAVSLTLQSGTSHLEPDAFLDSQRAYRDALPEVSRQIGVWCRFAPASIAPRIWDATAAMAERMAHWATTGWVIITEADLNRYTFGVAGAVGLLLSDLWAWYDGTQTDRHHAIGFGRGLQAVNILRNRSEDLAREVDFFPHGWSQEEVQAYARRNLVLADAYTQALSPGPAREFCKVPLTLAYATLDALARGERKLERSTVLRFLAALDAGQEL